MIMKKINTLFAALAATAALLAAPALFAENSAVAPDTAAEAVKDGYVTRDYDFKGFTKLDVSGRFEVIFTKSKNYSIRVTVPAEAENLISVKVEEKTLKLGWNRNFTERWQKNLNDMKFTAEISMPELTSLEMSGSASFQTDDKLEVPNGEFSLELSGASRANALRINAKEIDVELSGASSCGLTGSYDRAEIEVSGAGNADFNITSDSAEIDVSGASDAEFEVKFGKANIDVSGASTASLSGTAETLYADVSGASKLRAKSLEAKDVTVEVSGASHCTVNATESLTVEDASGASSIKYKAPKNVNVNIRSVSRSSSVQRID